MFDIPISYVKGRTVVYRESWMTPHHDTFYKSEITLAYDRWDHLRLKLFYDIPLFAKDGVTPSEVIVPKNKLTARALHEKAETAFGNISLLDYPYQLLIHTEKNGQVLAQVYEDKIVSWGPDNFKHELAVTKPATDTHEAFELAMIGLDALLENIPLKV